MILVADASALIALSACDQTQARIHLVQRGNPGVITMISLQSHGVNL